MIDNYHILNADVIIIGAGISGLTAARALLEIVPSLNILILEATSNSYIYLIFLLFVYPDRIGGRIASKPLAGKSESYQMYDVGAHWINTQQKEVINLLKELAISTESSLKRNNKTVIIDFEGEIYKQSREKPLSFLTTVGKLELVRFVIKIETLCKQQTLNDNLASMNLKQFIEENIKNESVKKLIFSIILKHFGVTANEITLGFYVYFCISTYGITKQLNFYQNGLHEFWIKVCCN